MLLGKTFYFHCVSLQQVKVYKRVLANLILGRDPALDKHPMQEGVSSVLNPLFCHTTLRDRRPLSCHAALRDMREGSELTREE